VERLLNIPPAPIAPVRALERTLGVSFAVAQVLVRRGLGEEDVARAWLAAGERHDPSAFAGIDAAVALVLSHVRAGTRVTVHGDYDVDGVCSTAILVRALRALGGDVDWYLPSRSEDGYGLSAATVQRLAERGTRLLLTADCAITAVDEVALARAAGMDVVVTDHHSPRADGSLPDAPIVHPAVCGYPCPDLCAAGVAHKLAAALLSGAGQDPAGADEDLDLVALATVADCVPLRDENRRLVREGLHALATSRKPGIRALLRVAKVDPSALDARAIGFRLAPRINAAGRLYRADAGLELVLTDDAERAAAIADELDHANAERRHTETRILFEAEARVREIGEQPAYVLAGEGWHPGVIGIVASRIAERHHRPCVMIALEGDEGTGSGRSIPAFDLLGALDASAEHLLRHGGHRAAAGCTIARERVDGFRATFVEHARAVLRAEDLVPTERVDAVVAGDELGLALAEELERLAPFGIGNPSVSLLVPAARLVDARPMGEEGRHVRFTVEAGGHRARAVAFGISRLPDGDVHDATFTLELNEWNGAVEPRLVLRHAQAPAPGAVVLAGEPEDPTAAAVAELAAPLPVAGATSRAAGVPRDRRGGGVAGTLAALVASGEPVLVACADARRRRGHLEGRLGGFAVAAWHALEREPGLVAQYAHVLALDPPTADTQAALVDERFTLAWGEPETEYALRAHEAAYDLRPVAAAVYRALRDGALPDAVAAAPSPAAAGRALRVLDELGLVRVDGAAVALLPARRTELDASVAFRAYTTRLAEGRARLAAPPRAARAA
jgi:single-stranded-DNA-specific exonuclease